MFLSNPTYPHPGPLVQVSSFVPDFILILLIAFYLTITLVDVVKSLRAEAKHRRVHNRMRPGVGGAADSDSDEEEGSTWRSGGWLAEEEERIKRHPKPHGKRFHQHMTPFWCG